jgi:hypothetical protein
MRFLTVIHVLMEYDELTNDSEDGIDGGKDDGEQGHPVISSQTTVLVTDAKTSDDNTKRENRKDDADGDDSRILRDLLDLGTSVDDPGHVCGDLLLFLRLGEGRETFSGETEGEVTAAATKERNAMKRK